MAEYVGKEQVIKALQEEIDLLGEDNEEDRATVEFAQNIFKIAQNVVRKLPSKDI